MKDAVVFQIRVPSELANTIYEEISNNFIHRYTGSKLANVYFLDEMATDKEKVVCLKIQAISFRTALISCLAISKYFSLLEVSLARWQKGEINWAAVRLYEKVNDWYVFDGEFEFSYSEIFHPKPKSTAGLH